MAHLKQKRENTQAIRLAEYHFGQTSLGVASHLASH